MSWTDSEIETLKRMVAQGDTYATIQRYIPNKTRNACIGKALRLGLIQGTCCVTARGGRPRKDPDIAPLREKAIREAQPDNAPRSASFKGHRFMMLPDDAPELPQITDAEKQRDFFGGSFMGHPPENVVVTKTEPLKHALPGEFIVTEAKVIEPVRITEETDDVITIAMDDPQWEDMNGNPVPHDAPLHGVTLNDRRAHQCCWPINDGGPYLFCGAKKDVGSNYCQTHHKLMYKKGRAHESNWVPAKVSAFKFRKT